MYKNLSFVRLQREGKALSKIKLLLDVVSDMRSLADSIQAVVEAMANNEAVETTEPVAEEKKTATKKVEKPKQKEVTLEDVRSVLAVKSQQGLTAGVREIIQKYGANKLSEIDPKYYADILKDAEVLGNE